VKKSVEKKNSSGYALQRFIKTAYIYMEKQKMMLEIAKITRSFGAFI